MRTPSHRRLAFRTLAVALALSMMAPSGAAGTLWIRDDTGAHGSTLDFDYTDDTAVKRLVLTPADLSGATSARLWIYAASQNCGATGGTQILRANGSPFTTYDPCAVWGASYGWVAIPTAVPLGSLAAGTNAFEAVDVGGSFLDRGSLFGIDTSVDFGRSDARQNTVDMPGELMWCLEIATTAAGGGTSCAPCTPTTPPGAVTLTAAYVATLQADLDWTPAASTCPLTSHEVQRSTAGGPWTTIATLPGSAITHLDSGLAQCTAYDYRVRAGNGFGWGPYSNVASITTPATSPPGAPTLTATAGPPTSANLAWTAPSSVCPVLVYEVERQVGTGPWTLLVTKPPFLMTHHDPGLAGCTTYNYRVRAANSGGWGPYSAPASYTTPQMVPNIVPSTTVTMLDPVTARVTWTVPAPNGCPIDSYNVARWVSPTGPVGVMATVPAPATQYDDGPLAPCLNYTYYVQAVNSAGPGLFSPAAFYKHDPLGICP